MELLLEHGVLLPPNMQGLTEEQIVELKLKDEFADVCIPSGGHTDVPDPMGRRNGRGSHMTSLTILNMSSQFMAAVCSSR